MKKKYVSIFTLMILLATMVGLTFIVSTTALAEDQITISLTWWGDTKRNEIYNEVADLFEAANPDIKVNRPFSSWSSYWEKLSTQMASGKAPDVVGMHQRFVSEYAQRGALTDLQPYVDSGVIDVSDIPNSVFEGGYINDKLYMFSQGVTGSGMGYNTAVFDNLGVKYPDTNWTWEDYKNKIQEIKDAAEAEDIDIWPSTDLSTDIYNFSYWVRTHGEHLFSESGEIGFSKDLVISWFTLWDDLRSKELIPEATTVVEYTGLPLEQSLFATNKVALTGMPASQIWLYQEQVTNNGQINMVRFPHIKDGKDGEYLSGAFWTVSNNSEHPEAAAKFINFFLNDPEAQKAFKIEQGVPPTTTGVENVKEFLTEPQVRSVEFIQNELVEHASKEPYPPAGMTEITANFEEFALEVAYGFSTPEEAADDFLARCEEILSKN